MEKFEQLNDFIEGNLAKENEQELFSSLASDDELRGEFKSLMSMNAAIKNNRNDFKRSDKSKKAVFAALGLSVPIAGSAAGAAGAAGYSMKSLLTSSIISAVASALLVFFIMGTPSDNITDGQKQETQTAGDVQNNIPLISNIELDDEAATEEDKPVKEKIKYVYVPVEVPSISKQKESKQSSSTDIVEKINDGKQNAENESELLSKDEIEKLQELKLNNENDMSMINFNPAQTMHILPDNMQPNAPRSDMNRGWAIEWKGTEAFMLREPTVEPNDLSRFNNSSLALLYNVNNSWSFGAELRQETFFLSFTGEENGIEYIYEQQPQFTSLSMFTRYKTNFNSDFNPFGQITVGGNKIGIVGRSMVGLDYTPVSSLTLLLGLEYSNMFYQYQSERFNSGKIGINYGVQYNF